MPKDPARSVITRRVAGGVKRQRVRVNGLFRLPNRDNFVDRLANGAPVARPTCVLLTQLPDGRIRLSITVSLEDAKESVKDYSVDAITEANAAQTARSIVELLYGEQPLTLRIFSSAARRAAKELKRMDIEHCTEWLVTLAGQEGMPSTIGFGRPNPNTAITLISGD